MKFGLLTLAVLGAAGWASGCAQAVEENRAPTAFAGFDQIVRVGARAVLDGSTSRDPDQDALIYRWTMDRRPAGALARLAGDDAARPQQHLTPDVPGLFVVRLSVSDGDAESFPDLVNVYAVVGTPGSTVVLPRARAPRNFWVARDAASESYPEVSLSGEAESIEPGRVPRYTWQWIARPALSRLGPSDLYGAETPSCRFTPDESGDFVLSLQVSDGQQVSVPEFVTVRAFVDAPDPTPPIADAGGGGGIRLGDAARMDGGASSGAGAIEPISRYRWRLALLPDGVSAPFDEQEVESFLLVPEREGLYLLRLDVESGGQVSAPDFAAVLVLEGDDG